jgi:hypothetical protein
LQGAALSLLTSGAMGLGNGPLDVPGEPPRQGIQRRSQAANTLLQKPELGKVRIP